MFKLGGAFGHLEFGRPDSSIHNDNPFAAA